MKITHITDEQIAKFPEWTKKWIDIGLSTEPADFDLATNAALKAYQLCNLNKPMVILRMGSPFSATLGGIIAFIYLKELSKIFELDGKVLSQVRSQVRSQVESQVLSQVWSQVGSQVWSQVESQVRSQVWSQVGSQVWSQVRSQVRSQVESQVLSQVGSQVGSQVLSQVESQVLSQVGSQVGSQVLSQVESQVWSQDMRASVNNDTGGTFWAGWCAYISFFRDIMGWDDIALKKRFVIDEELTKSCGWTWWHENVLAISDRPKEINRDDRGRLHCENGASISYRDGWSLYHWHGVSVDEYIILRPREITIEKIESQENTEVRRVMMERYGHAAYIKESGAKLIHQDKKGKLYRKEIDNDEPLVMVSVINSTAEPDGTFNNYWLRVPPHCKKASEAVAWTFGLDLKQYKPIVET